MLRKRVLDTAVTEINEKTDITVSYELEKQGRKVMAILLKVEAKKESPAHLASQSTVHEKLSQFGLKEVKIQELVEKHDEEYLRANIAIVEEGVRKGNIVNVA